MPTCSPVKGGITQYSFFLLSHPQVVEHSFVPLYSDQARCSFELYAGDAMGLRYVDLSASSTSMHKVAELVLDIPLIPGVAQRSRTMIVKFAFGRAEIGVSALDSATGQAVNATFKFAFTY